MLDTYKSDHSSIAIRQREVQNYTVISEVTVVGWEIQVAVSKEMPLILFRAADWDGVRPRYAVTATHAEHFRRVLQDLSKLSMEKRDQLLTLAYEEPIWISGGLSPIDAQDAEAQKLWKALIADAA